MEKKEFLIIAITVFITVVVWIIADIYHISTTQQVHLEETETARDLDFEINIETLDILQSRN